MKPLSDYAQKLDSLRDRCPVRAALDVIGGRWKPSILFELNDRICRFSDLQAALSQVTAQALTVQLRQLEADGVILRTVYPEVPSRVEYALTERGRALAHVMDELERWGAEYVQSRAKENVPAG